jgi:hypothetical protein
MDDIKILHAARPAPADPSPTAHAAARAALLRRIATPGAARSGGRRFRSPRVGPRVTAAGLGLTVATAGAVVVVAASRTPQSSPGHPAEVRLSAQGVLYQAAENAQAQAFIAPRGDQWVFVETRERSTGKPDLGQVQTVRTPAKTRIHRTWTRADGTKMAFIRNGRLVVAGIGSASPPSDYASLAALPRDPAALLTWARGQVPSAKGGNDAGAFGILDAVLSSGMLPPAQHAAIYRALAKISGVTLDKNAADIAGRPALGVAYTIEGWLNEEILFDPKTYAYLGQRSIAIKDHTEKIDGQKIIGKNGTVRVIKGGPWTVKKGTIDLLTARIAVGVVDAPGQRP